MKFCIEEYSYLVTHLCSSNTYSKKEKLKYSILLQSHIIEKGLSLKDVRPGFGVPKIRRLLIDLENYWELFHDEEILFFSLSIINSYIEFNNRVNFPVDDNIKAHYQSLYEQISEVEWDKHKSLCGGIIEYKKDQIEGGEFPYKAFVQSRHSIRSFTGESVERSLIEEALSIAEYTPSACNRQPWGAYVFTEKPDIISLLEIQGGARQFKEDVGTVIIITSTANAFSVTESHQPYVNGGLYAMNLLLALHSQGLGTIPLNLGIDHSKLKRMKSMAKIPDSELLILMIAIGHIPYNLRVACSKRFPYTDYTRFS